MAKKIDPRILRERREQDSAAPEPSPEGGPMTPQASRQSPLPVSSVERVPEPVLPEANTRAESLRGWGRGTMLLAIVNGIVTAVGGVITLQNGGTEVAVGMFVAALSLIMVGFWFRDVHYAAADGLDALTEAVKRLRRSRG